MIIRTEGNNTPVQKVGGVSAPYYREKETGDSTRPAQREVAIEDLWDTLVGVHSQLSHGGRHIMERYLIAWHPCAPPCDTALFRSLSDLLGYERKEEHAQDYTQGNHPRHRWATQAG